jgi:hypothetical protein
VTYASTGLIAQELLATEPRDTGTTKSLAMEENLDVTIGQRSAKSYLRFFVLWNLHNYQGSPQPFSLNGV